MKTISIPTFKYGIDYRRESLISNPGSLVLCDNAHINDGGEIEKRKAFWISGSTFPSDCYGLEVTDQGLTTFGSGAHVVTDFPLLPDGVNRVLYQRLLHPINSTYKMVNVINTANFNGKAFVIAKFGSDNVGSAPYDIICYYNGVVVDHSRNGVVLNGMTSVGTMSTDLKRQIQAISGWGADDNIDLISGGVYSGQTVVKSPTTVRFTSVITNTSAAGYLAHTTVDYDSAGGLANGIDNPVEPKSAVASFNFVVGTIDNGAPNHTNEFVQVTAPANSNGTGTVYLVDALLTQSTAGQTAWYVAARINEGTSKHGYSALFNTNGDVFVYAPITWGNVTFNLTVTFQYTAAANHWHIQAPLSTAPGISGGVVVVTTANGNSAAMAGLTGTPRVADWGGNALTLTAQPWGGSLLTYKWSFTTPPGITPTGRLSLRTTTTTIPSDTITYVVGQVVYLFFGFAYTDVPTQFVAQIRLDIIPLDPNPPHSELGGGFTLYFPINLLLSN